MQIDDGQVFLKLSDLFQDALPNLQVQFHQLVLFRREIAGFSQDGIGSTDLADVVRLHADTDDFNLFGR